MFLTPASRSRPRLNGPNTLFQQSGSAAVKRSVTSRLRDVYSAADFGVRGDGAQYGRQIQNAINAAYVQGSPATPVINLPVGTIRTNQTLYLNTWSLTSLGNLTVPGLKLKGAGKGITILDTSVANGYAIVVNGAWQSGFKALYGITTTNAGGALASATYVVQITMTDPAGNEIQVTLSKAIVVTGPTGRIDVVLPSLTAVAPGYTYNIYCDTTLFPGLPGHYATVNAANAIGLAGGQTVAITAVGSVQVAPLDKRAIWQEANISDMSITNSTGAANASGILYFKVGYANVTSVYFNGLTEGITFPGYTGDLDGSFEVTVYDCKFDAISLWGMNAAPGALEFSNLTVDTCIFNLCGTLPTNYVLPENYAASGFTISTIANSAVNPTVTTAVPHTLISRDQVYIRAVAGMTLPDGWYRAAVLSPTTYNLQTLSGDLVDTSGLGAYTPNSGRSMLAWRPPQWDAVNATSTVGGGLAWLGLIGTFRNLGFTQCKNVSFYASENGLSDNLTMEGVDLENTYGVGAYIGGLAGGAWNQGEVITTSGIGSTITHVQIGTGFSAGAVKNLTITNIKIRSNVFPAVGFSQYKNTAIGSPYIDTVRVRGITWSTYDDISAGLTQERFSGVTFDPVVGECKFSVTGVNTIKLVGVGGGTTMPIHLGRTSGSGEWVAAQIPVAGVAGAVAGLAASTKYYFYVNSNALAVFPVNVVFTAASLVAPVTGPDGYSILSSDPTQLYVGTATTDAAGNLQAAGFQDSNYPPRPLIAGQYPATATNDNALLGYIGQYVESAIAVGAAVALVTATAKTVTSISLPPGDWDVDILGYILPAATTSTTLSLVSISLVNNTLDVTAGRFASFALAAGTLTPNNEISQAIPPYRLSLAATTTVYFVALSNFTISTSSAYGLLRARRAR